MGEYMVRSLDSHFDTILTINQLKYYLLVISKILKTFMDTASAVFLLIG